MARLPTVSSLLRLKGFRGRCVAPLLLLWRRSDQERIPERDTARTDAHASLIGQEIPPNDKEVAPSPFSRLRFHLSYNCVPRTPPVDVNRTGVRVLL